MTRRKAIAALMALAAAGLVAGGVLWRNYSDEELFVYVALAQSVQRLPGIEEVAFLSSPSTCDASARHFEGKPENLFQKFIEANSAESEPRALEKLSDIVQVVSWKDTKMIHEAGGYLKAERFSKTRLVRISRAGFSGDKAVVCVKPGGYAELYFFQRADGPYWKIIEEKTVWVS
jgi:hypothetical protein